MKLLENPMQCEAPLAGVDFRFDRGKRLDFQTLREEKSKRALRVGLQLRRAELQFMVEQAFHPTDVRLPFEHSFVLRKTRLFESSGRHLRTGDNGAGRRRRTGTLDEQAKQAGRLLTDLLGRDQAQIGLCQHTFVRGNRIEFAVRSDLHRLGAKQAAKRRQIRTREKRLTGSADRRITERQTLASAGDN